MPNKQGITLQSKFGQAVIVEGYFKPRNESGSHDGSAWLVKSSSLGLTNHNRPV